MVKKNIKYSICLKIKTYDKKNYKIVCDILKHLYNLKQESYFLMYLKSEIFIFCWFFKNIIVFSNL